MPTLAEQWVQQGREEGRHESRKEGELTGRIRVYQKMLGLQVNESAE